MKKNSSFVNVYLTDKTNSIVVVYKCFEIVFLGKKGTQWMIDYRKWIENKTFLKKSFSLQTKTISLVAICSQYKESLRKKS